MVDQLGSEETTNMSAGKRKIIIDNQHYLNSTDPFRQQARKYWTITPGKNLRFAKKSMEARTHPPLNVPFKMSFGEPRVRNRIDFYEIEQKVTIKADSSAANSLWDALPDAVGSVISMSDQGQVENRQSAQEFMWAQYVTGTLFPPPPVGATELPSYFDHAFEMSLPYSEHELKILNLTQDVNTANVTPRYNFYIERYEEALKKKSVPEQVLPNIYALKQKEKNDSAQISPQKDVDDQVTLGGTIETELIKFRMKMKNRTHRTLEMESTDRYFNNYGKYYAKLYRNGRHLYKLIREKCSSMLFSKEMVDNLGDYNEKKYLFPMYTEIEFLTDRNVYISKVLRETELSEYLMRHIAAHDKQNTFAKLDFFELHETVANSAGTQHTEYDPKPNMQSILKIKNFNTFDFLEWWSMYSDKESDISRVLDSSVMIGTPEVSMSEHDRIRNGYKKIVTDLIFKSKLRKFILSLFRSYEAILRGNLCYDETLVYKVQKFKGRPRGKPIQTYFLCNTDKQDLITLVDTQVKYDTEYTYVISAYQMVLGNEYYYKNLTYGTKIEPATQYTNESESHIASFTAVTRPSIKIIEVPLYAETELMMDTPPVAPDVDIVPYRNINNRLLFNFKGSIGEYDLMPISFNEDERKQYEKLRRAQKRPPRTPIKFRSDDPSAVFEVYRTTEKPKSYQDFKNSKLVSVYTDVSEETIQKASAASYIERISPNTKYYYTFRSVDVHGHKSYPSAVYEVEIIDDAGTVFSIVNTIEFAEGTPRATSKNLKKYLYIIPNLNHAMLNIGKSGLIDDDGNKVDSARRLGVASDGLQLGYQDDTIWGKRFKVRLTSRATGRKIDLNLNFMHNHIITDDEYRVGPRGASGGKQATVAGLLYERNDRRITHEFYKRLKRGKTQEEDLSDLL